MYSVLLVDDEPFIVDGLEVLIDWHTLGLDVIAKVSNGVEALEFIKCNQVDIIITDIKMPKMTGITLIEEVKKIDSNCKYIILSGHDDFEFVKKGIQLGIENYLTKPVNTIELNSTLEDIVNKLDLDNNPKQDELNTNEWTIIRNNILSRWISDTITSEELQNRSAMLNLTLDSSCYNVAILTITLDENQYVSINSMNQLCQKQLEKDTGIMSFEDIDGRFIIIFSSEDYEHRIRDIKTKLGKLYHNLKALNVNSTITLGATVSSYKTVSLSYRKAEELLSYYLIYPDKTVLYSSDVDATIDGIDCSVNHETITQLILSGDTNELTTLINHLFLRFLKSDVIPRETVKNLIVEIYMNLYKSVGSRFDSIRTIIINEHSSMMHFISTLEDLPALESALIKSLCTISNTLETKDSSTKPVIKQILDYIHTNYQQELSLKTLSYEFHMNATYLGQLFKKDTNTTFPNYLNQYRIEKAKSMLVDTTLKTSQIAKDIGYPDPNYFYRIFKKYVGISPSDYRQL